MMATDYKTELLVIGGGIFGLCCAYQALKSGFKVILAEAHQIGAGASGGLVGAMSPHTPDNWNPKKQYQLDALISASGFWAEIESISRLPTGYGRVGRFTAIDSDRQLKNALLREKSYLTFWPTDYHWQVINNSLDIHTSHGIIYDTLSARINPTLACLALTKAIKNLGGIILLDWQMSEVFDHYAMFGQQKIHADHIILAMGYEGLKTLPSTRSSGVKGQAMLVDFDDQNHPSIHGNGLYIIHHLDGTTAIGSTNEVTWKTHDTTDGQLDELRIRAEQLYPKLVGTAEIKRWANLRPKAPKRTPIVGKHPEMDHVFIMNGGYKIGFGLAHHLGKSVVDIITELPSNLPENFSVTHHLKD